MPRRFVWEKLCQHPDGIDKSVFVLVLDFIPSQLKRRRWDRLRRRSSSPACERRKKSLIITCSKMRTSSSISLLITLMKSFWRSGIRARLRPRRMEWLWAKVCQPTAAPPAPSRPGCTKSSKASSPAKLDVSTARPSAAKTKTSSISRSTLIRTRRLRIACDASATLKPSVVIINLSVITAARTRRRRSGCESKSCRWFLRCSWSASSTWSNIIAI